MKVLYLIRHAKSSWSDPSLRDFDRPLNKRGRRDAPFMGRRLARVPIQPQVLVSSPARRARKTARMIARELGYAKDSIIFLDEIYEAGLETLLDIIKTTNSDIEAFGLVGHNHVITTCAEWLTGERIVNIPTCGIVAIEFSAGSWNEVDNRNGRLLFFDYPKLHLNRSRTA